MAWNFGLFGRRRRRVSTFWTLVILFGLVGYDLLGSALQKQESWQGVVTRVYLERSILSSRKSSGNCYWDVRTTDGELRTIRIRVRDHWYSARPGDSVIKREGILDPEVLTRR